MREKTMKRIFLLIVGMSIIIAIVIITKQNKNQEEQITQVADEKEYKTELRIGISNLDTFDPIISTNKNVQDVCKLIYEPLLTINEEFKIKGVLAEEWAKTTENSYIVKLKQGIKWHNGDELTAADVQFTINKIKQENFDSIYKENVQNISNITIIDNYTIRFDLIEDEAFFEYNLIFPIECASDYQNENVQIPSGTGLYKIYEMTTEKIELVVNQNTQNTEEIYLKSIIIKNYETIGELYNNFKIGNIDLFNTDNTEYSDYIGTLGYTAKSFYGRDFNFLAINTNQSALCNTEVRKAISYAIDKDKIIANVYNNKYYTAEYPLAYGNWLYSNNSTSSDYSPEQANKILEENEWEYRNEVWQKKVDGKNIQLVLNLLVNSNDELRVKVAENIKQQLEEVGIKINIVKVSSTKTYIANKNYDIALLEMNIGVSPDLSLFFGEDNLANYENQETIEIMKELKDIKDENMLKEKYNQLLERCKSDNPYIGLYFSSSTLIYKSKLIGNINPTWYNLFYNIENWKLEA